MGIHQLEGDSTGPRYNMLCFHWKENITLAKSNLTFIWDGCCHLTLCSVLMEPNFSLPIDRSQTWADYVLEVARYYLEGPTITEHRLGCHGFEAWCCR